MLTFLGILWVQYMYVKRARGLPIFVFVLIRGDFWVNLWFCFFIPTSLLCFHLSTSLSLGLKECRSHDPQLQNILDVKVSIGLFIKVPLANQVSLLQQSSQLKDQ